MSQKKNKSNERGSAETITTVRQCMAMRQMSENNKRSCSRLRLVNRSKDGNMEAGKDKIKGNQDKINGKIGAYRQSTTCTNSIAVFPRLFQRLNWYIMDRCTTSSTVPEHPGTLVHINNPPPSS